MVGTSSMAHGTGRRVDGGLHCAIRLPRARGRRRSAAARRCRTRARWLALMGCAGPGKVYRFAQIVAAADARARDLGVGGDGDRRLGELLPRPPRARRPALNRHEAASPCDSRAPAPLAFVSGRLAPPWGSCRSGRTVRERRPDPAAPRPGVLGLRRRTRTGSAPAAGRGGRDDATSATRPLRRAPPGRARASSTAASSPPRSTRPAGCSRPGTASRPSRRGSPSASAGRCRSTPSSSSRAGRARRAAAASTSHGELARRRRAACRGARRVPPRPARALPRGRRRAAPPGEAWRRRLERGSDRPGSNV